jgi:hypothetical protein
MLKFILTLNSLTVTLCTKMFNNRRCYYGLKHLFRFTAVSKTAKSKYMKQR